MKKDENLCELLTALAADLREDGDTLAARVCEQAIERLNTMSRTIEMYVNERLTQQPA